MAGGTNKLSDATLRKMLGRESPGDNFYADGDGLSVKVTKSGAMAVVKVYWRRSAPCWQGKPTPYRPV